MGDDYDADVAGVRAAGIAPIFVDVFDCDKRSRLIRQADSYDVRADCRAICGPSLRSLRLEHATAGHGMDSLTRVRGCSGSKLSCSKRQSRCSRRVGTRSPTAVRRLPGQALLVALAVVVVAFVHRTFAACKTQSSGWRRA